MNPDPSVQIYEKDVILNDDVEYQNQQQNQQQTETNEFVDKRAKTGEEEIEREELSDE